MSNRLRKAAFGITALVGVAMAAFWVVTEPDRLPDSALFDQIGDAARGEAVFYAGGCSSCHGAPQSRGDEKLILSGGRKFPSAFGTFIAPNISSNEEFGIGGWSSRDLANAMIKGVSPDGEHYYPAFPYVSYSRVPISDVVDLKAFLDTLPGSANPSAAHELPLPFQFRRGLGLWKILNFNDTPAANLSPELARGQYLVEGLGHCAECHTSRDITGGLNRDKWMAGAPNPEGKGRVPNITGHADGIGSWSAGDLAYYLETGFTPDFDSVGGLMVDVVDNFAHLSAEDREAVAKYLLAIPQLPNAAEAPK